MNAPLAINDWAEEFLTEDMMKEAATQRESDTSVKTKTTAGQSLSFSVDLSAKA